jgi:exosome complex RNA-binding protein Rrp4
VRVPPTLVKRTKQHFHSLACGVDVIFGVNGYIWISPPGQSSAVSVIAQPSSHSNHIASFLLPEHFKLLSTVELFI